MITIHLHDQARINLEKDRLQDNSGGVYQDGQKFVWYLMKDGIFDTGESDSLVEALKHITKN